MDAANDSIKGSSTSLVDALPGHRILAIKYKEQIVWDREKKYDRVVSEGGIEQVIETYDDWKRNKDANEEFLKQRQSQVATHIRLILGLNRYDTFKTLSSELQSTLQHSSVSAKLEAERYVKAAIDLFQQARSDPSESLDPALIPRSDLEAVECLSELVALSPQARLREHVLNELEIVLNRSQGRSSPDNVEADAFNRELPEIAEDDLTETFVRGSGPGGQKINKTNNKVLLIHNPTQLRVECQETRSLQQNRKIARKRMRLKLDEFLNGSQSRVSVKAEKAATKKQKAKARARARNRKKTAAKEEKD
jgi:protein subunit release factor A